MKRKLLMLFMFGGGLLGSANPDWCYGRTLHPNTSLFDVSKDRIIETEPSLIKSLISDLNMLGSRIASFCNSVDMGLIWRDRLIKSQLINRQESQLIEIELHIVQDKIEVYQHLMAPQNLEQFKSIYKNYLSEYLMLKTTLDLVLLLHPLSSPEYDPTEKNMVLNDIHFLIHSMRSALNQDVNQDNTSCRFITILNDSGIDKTTFSQHLSAIEDALAQISPDYNPHNFKQTIADLESLEASLKK